MQPATEIKAVGTNSLETSTPTGKKTSPRSQQQESQPCCRLEVEMLYAPEKCCSCDSAVPDEPMWGDRTHLIGHNFSNIQAKATRLLFQCRTDGPQARPQPCRAQRSGPGRRCLALPKTRLWCNTGYTHLTKRNLPPTSLHLRESHLLRI